MKKRGRAAKAAVVVAFAFAWTSCGSPQEQETLATPATTTEACPPALTPGYLPDGAEPVEREPYFGSPERTRTWKSADAFVQLGEGFSGDHGEEPRLKSVEVRGTTGSLLPDADRPDVISIDWFEETRCGGKQYILVTENLSEDETVRIAQSLEGATK